MHLRGIIKKPGKSPTGDLYRESVGDVIRGAEILRHH